MNSLLANTVFTFACLGCGFFITVDTLPPWVTWVPHISYLHYGFSALVVNEFKVRLCHVLKYSPTAHIRHVGS